MLRRRDNRPAFFAKRLASAIAAAGLRKNEVARRAQVTPGTLSRYLHGQVMPSPAVLALVAQTLGVTVEYFTEEETRADRIDPKSIPHMDILSMAEDDPLVYIPDAVALTGLDAEDRRAVIRVLHVLGSGHADVREHLLRQLTIYEQAIQARRKQPVKDV